MNNYTTTIIADIAENITEEPNTYDGLPSQNPCEAKMVPAYTSSYIKLGSAVVLFIILMLTERRKNRCCGFNDKGGMLMSVNFLENKTNRSMIVAAFILTTLDVLDAIFGWDEIGAGYELAQVFGDFEIVQVLYRISMVFFLSFVYLPLFHCISVPTLSRQCLGLCYILINGPINLLSCTTVCHYTELTNNYELLNQLAKLLISLAAGSFLTYKFIFRIIRLVRPPTPKMKESYQVLYIKNLLRKPSSLQGIPMKEEITHRIRRFLYQNIPGFRYSISILISVCLGLLLYIMMISTVVGRVVDWYFILHKVLDIYREDLNATMPNVVVDIAKMFSLRHQGSDKSMRRITIAVFLETQLDCVFASFVLATSLAGFQVCSTVVYMLKAYRSNVLSMYRQEMDDNVMEGVDHVNLVVSAIQFGGYQVAHMIWGYTLQLVVFLILFFIFVEVLILPPILYDYWGVIYSFVAWLIPIFLVKFGSKFIQRVLVREAFLVNQGRIFGIDNRKCFFNMMFFMFFYNIFSGLISCVLRIIKVTILGVWYFPRLDRSIFPHSFEKFDEGYKSYVCLLKLEERQNNILLLCFIQLLTDKCCRTGSVKYFDLFVEFSSPVISIIKRHSARNRWFLAWTLIHNPSLRSGRRRTTIRINNCESTRV